MPGESVPPTPDIEAVIVDDPVPLELQGVLFSLSWDEAGLESREGKLTCQKRAKLRAPSTKHKA